MSAVDFEGKKKKFDKETFILEPMKPRIWVFRIKFPVSEIMPIDAIDFYKLLITLQVTLFYMQWGESDWNKIRNLKARTTSKIKKNIFLYVMFIKPVNPKGNQPWILVGRTNAEPEEPILWSLDSKNPLIGKDWGQEEKGVTDDEMVGWCHRLNGHEFK